MSQIESILQTAAQHDAFAAIQQIAGGSDVLAAARTFVEVMRHFYWKQKNLGAALMFGQAGVSFGLASAAGIEPSDADLATQLRGIAKGLTYDIASFTWPGWDEPGIASTSNEIALGFEAAKANLRLAQELNKGGMPMSRAHWMLAGHHLCVANYAAAKEHYLLGSQHAIAAGSRSDELLSTAFGKLTDLLTSPGNARTQKELSAVEKDLRVLEHGPDFVSQIQTALRVFTTTPPVAPLPSARLS